jgi:hypothetical protein
MASSSGSSPQFLPRQYSRANQISRLPSVLEAALALGAIIFAVYRIHSINDQITAAEARLKDINSAVESKQRELDGAQSKLKEANAQIEVAQKIYSRIASSLPAGAAQQAIQQVAESDPQAASLPPLIYIQIASEDQRPQARKIQDALHAAGYSAPGIEYVGAKSPNHSQLRYFVSTDAGPVMDKVLSLLRAQGLDIDSQFVRMSGAPRALRPNQFEVWLGQDYKPSRVS